jgi:hypothetical protein
VTDAGCCGAPWLHAGQRRGVHQGRREEHQEAGRRSPGGHRHRGAAAHVQLRDQEGLPDYVGGSDAELVAEHTYDAAEYLMQVHRATTPRSTPSSSARRSPRSPITRRVTSGPRASGFTSRDLMKLTGAEVELVQQCSGIGTTWGCAPATRASRCRSPSGSALGSTGPAASRRRRLPSRQHRHRRADRSHTAAPDAGDGSRLRHRAEPSPDPTGAVGNSPGALRLSVLDSSD